MFKPMFNTLKESIRDILRPLIRKMPNISPNILTLFGLFLGIMSALLFAQRNLILAGIFLLISGFFDVLDGEVARENNRITKYGGFLDSVSDRFVDSTVLIGTMYSHSSTEFIGTLAIVGSLMVSYTRARAEAIGATASIGIGDRPTRMSIIIFGAFINRINFAIFLVAMLSFITIFQRIEYVRKTTK